MKLGLNPNTDDIQTLRLVTKEPTAAVPPFNMSRLIALRLVERSNQGHRVTERGRGLLQEE